MVGVTVASTLNVGVDTTYGPTGFAGLVGSPVVLGLSLFASIGGVLFGYDQGVISGVLVMDNFVRKIPPLAPMLLPLDILECHHPLDPGDGNESVLICA